MGVAARLWVEQNFSQLAMVARYAQLFRTLAGKDAKHLV
jgi:hypothetical protein